MRLQHDSMQFKCDYGQSLSVKLQVYSLRVKRDKGRLFHIGDLLVLLGTEVHGCLIVVLTLHWGSGFSLCTAPAHYQKSLLVHPH